MGVNSNTISVHKTNRGIIFLKLKWNNQYLVFKKVVFLFANN
jgi:hypothetical protein